MTFAPAPAASAVWPRLPQWRARLGRSVRPGTRLALVLAATAMLSLVVRVPFLSVPLTADEAGYAYIAHWMARGAALYRDLWFDRPQAIFGLYAAVLLSIGPTVEAIRGAAAVYNAAAVALLGALGARLFGRRAGAVAALAYAMGSAAPTIEGFTANGELFMNLPSVGAVLLAYAGHSFGAGAALALATALKPTALPSAGPAVIALLLTYVPVAGETHRRARLRATALAGAGAVAVFAPFVLHGISEGGPEQYWYAIAGFRLEAHSAFSAGARFVDEFRQTGPHVFFGLLPLWLLTVWWLKLSFTRRCEHAARPFHLTWAPWSRASLAVALYLAGSLVGAALGGYWYWHYFAGVLPALALASGAVAPALLAALRRPGVLSRSVVGGLSTASIVVSVGYNLTFVGETPEDTSWRLYRNDAYVAGREVATYLRDRTTPEDTVFAAFSQPGLYYLSGRRSAGAHLYWTEINRVPGALDAVIGAMDDPHRCPKYVVRVQSELERPGRAAAFWDRVDQHYERETEIRGLVVYRRVMQ